MTRDELRKRIIQLMREMCDYIDGGGDYLDPYYLKLNDIRNNLRDELYGGLEDTEGE